MHTNSLPPSDRDAASDKKREPVKTYPCNETLRHKLRDLHDAPGSIWSYSVLGNKLGYSVAVISQYLSEDGMKYRGDISTLEKKISDFLTALERRRASNIETCPTKISEEIVSAFDYIRKQRQIGAVIAESGKGKSRAVEIILEENPLCLPINVTEWNCTKTGIMAAIWAACPHDGYDRSTPQFPWLVTKMLGSDRPFLFDNAHKLGMPALSLVCTFLDDTKCPGILLGLSTLVDKLVADLTSQSTSRVGIHWPIKIAPKTDKKLIAKMIRDICKDVNGELDQLVEYGQQVVDHHGAFRAFEQRLIGAAELRRSNAAETWTEAFLMAHSRSLHPCKLT